MYQKDRRPLQFEIDEVQDADGAKAATVHCHGGGWTNGFTSFSDRIKALIGEGAHIRLDLADVPDIDDSGLSLLAMVKVMATRQGNCRLELENLSPRLIELLRITGIDQIYADQKPAAPAGSSPGSATS